MINRYSTISEKDFDLYVPPVQAIGAALETAQKTYDTNFMFANELKNKYINALPQDRAAANELQSGWEQQVDSLVKKYNGDYSTASKDLYLLQKDIEKQYRQGSKAFAIESTYQAVQDSKKRNQARVASGDVSQALYQSAYDYFDKNYKGVQKQEDGTYTTASMPELAKSVDTLKAAREVVKDIKPRTVKETKRVDLGNGQYRLDTVETSKVDPNEVQNAIIGSIMSNDEYVNYAKQLAQFTGRDPMDIVNQELITVYNALGPAASGTFLDSNQQGKTEMDDFAKMKLQHQYALAEEYNKQKGRYALAAAKGELQTPETSPNIRLIGNVNNAQSKYQPLNGKLQSYAQGFNQSPMGMMIDAATRTLMPGLNPVPFGSQPVPMTSTVKQATVDQVIKSPKDFPNINVPLLASIRAANPKYTERQVMDQYDRSLTRQNNSEGVYVTAYRNSDTGIESAKLIMPQLLAGNADAYFIGADGTKRSYSSKEQQELAGNIQGGKIGSVGQARSFSGDLPVGETFPVPGGYVVTASNNIGLSNYNNYIRPKLFSFIGQGLMAGDRVPLDDPQGRQIQGIRITNEDADAKTGLKYTVGSIAFVATDNNGNVIMKNGQPDFFTRDGRLANEADIEEMMLAGDLKLQDTPKKTISGNNKNNAYYEKQ